MGMGGGKGGGVRIESGGMDVVRGQGNDSRKMVKKKQNPRIEKRRNRRENLITLQN
jgi:hypothetical protein